MGKGVAGNLNTSVIGIQRQILSRNKLAVLVNDNILRVFFIMRVHSNITFGGFCLALYLDYALRYVHINIAFGINRPHIRSVTADPDISVIRRYLYIAIIGYNRFYNLNVPGFGCNVYVAIGLYIAAVCVAYRNAACLR